MDFVITFGAILLALSMLLTVGILFSGIFKYIKKQYFPTSAFASRENIGSPEYAYKRVVKREVR
jgi:hypothetical protein